MVLRLFHSDSLCSIQSSKYFHVMVLGCSIPIPSTELPDWSHTIKWIRLKLKQSYFSQCLLPSNLKYRKHSTMVLDAAMIVSTLVTFTMNGMCCVYQMQEDEDLRRTIRKDMRVEYERQRVIDLERWAEHDSKERQHRSESSHNQDRRQRLLRQKLDLTSQASRDRGCQEREHAPGASDRSESSDQAVFVSHNHNNCVEDSKVTLKQSRSVPLSKFAQRNLAQKQIVQAASNMSSLLDSDNEQHIMFNDIADEDDSSLVDVDLH